jgi:hypothetical protein
MSTTIFSPRRFGLYLKQYVAANIKMWLLFSLAAIGVMTILFIFFILNSNLELYKTHILWFYRRVYTTSENLFYAGLFTLGLILTVTSFNNFSSKRSGVFYLMMPVTTFEKLLAHWLITIPLYLIVYKVIWIITSIIMNYIAGLIINLKFGLYIPFGIYSVVPVYIIVQSFFFAGTALTGKSSFIKTTLTALTIIFLVWAATIGIDYLLFDNFNKFNFNPVFSLYSPSFHSTILGNLMRPISILFIPVCYTLAYYFLKEKEV